VDGRKSLEGEDLSGLSVGAKCVSEGRNWVFIFDWDGMRWDDGIDGVGINEGGGRRFEMGKWNGKDEMLGVVLALTARSSNTIFLVLIMQCTSSPP
jgi:hypothetical protein